MTGKLINRYTSNEFHDWQKVTLPTSLVIQDLDAWALSVNDATDDFRPVALLELKRSSIAPAAWRPFEEDRPNYAALLTLARAAGVPVYVVYFQMGQPIEDDSLFHVFHLTDAVPSFHGRRKLMRADEFAARFPHPFEARR